MKKAELWIDDTEYRDYLFLVLPNGNIQVYIETHQGWNIYKGSYELIEQNCEFISYV